MRVRINKDEESYYIKECTFRSGKTGKTMV
jgi:hypothetical protein